MDTQRIARELTEAFEGQDFPVVDGNAILVPNGVLVEVMGHLKSSPEHRLDYLSCVSGVDYPKEGYLEVVYHLYSIVRRKGPLALKARTPREGSSIPSVTPLFRGAEFQEREIFDLFGIDFPGHPDLRRILMWDGYAHHPMRKDYVPENDCILPPSWADGHGPVAVRRTS